MARKDWQETPAPSSYEEWAAQEPCPECGARPGYNPTTGIEVKQGHTSNCSQWKQ